jgi:predicted nucleotide-binding protein (sugar kinase/HSP70/actin superfamily)
MLLRERMFRVKPYTKCLGCIRTDRIKCKDCMEHLVQNASSRHSGKGAYDVLRKSPKYKKLLDKKYPVRVLGSSFNAA